ETELLREGDRVVLRLRLCRCRARERPDDHCRQRRDWRELQRHTGRVRGLPDGLQPSERIAVQLEQATERSELRKLVMAGAARELGLPREARNPAMDGDQRRDERRRRDHVVAGYPWHELRGVRSWGPWDGS